MTGEIMRTDSNDMRDYKNVCTRNKCAPKAKGTLIKEHIKMFFLYQSFIYSPTDALVSCLKNNINPLNAELDSICYLLALLGAHHFLHVSRIRVKSLTLRLLMSYIYMEHLFLMFLDHTQRRTTVGRTALDE